MDDLEAGIEDVTGKPVKVGDIVEFYLCPEHGTMAPRFENEKVHGARCVDVIGCEITKSPIPGHEIRTFFAMNPALYPGAAFLSKINKSCRVIGHYPEDMKLLAQQHPFARIPGVVDQLCDEMRKNFRLIYKEG